MAGRMAVLSGTIFDIRKYSVHDGPGIRTTVFLKGCPLDCWWCHNPESQSLKPEPMLRPNLCIGCDACIAACAEGAIARDSDGQLTWDREGCVSCGECAETCVAGAREMAGRSYDTAEVLAELERDRLFYEESGGGVTFSGGEPLLQWRFLGELLRACRRMELHTAVDTSGFASREVFEGLLPDIDLVLYDLKHTDAEQHRKYTGVALEPILRNLRLLAERGVPVWLRVPLVPGINDDEANLRRLGELARGMPNIRQVNLLPYHHTAEGKYEHLGRTYRLPDTPSPTDLEMQRHAELLREYGLEVKIGG
jgi:pyruvate formate lyase activating enzyme